MIQSSIEMPPVDADSRLIRLVKSNAALVTIQKVSGVSSYAVMRREIDRICLEHGLIYTPSGGQGKFTTRFDKASTEATYTFRFNLCNWVAAYHEHFPQVTKLQLIDATGLTSRALDRARARPYDHDWSLTQLCRLATSLGMTFTELTSDCLSRNRLSLPRVNPETVLNPDNLGL